MNLDRVLSRWGAAAEFSITCATPITQDERVALNRPADSAVVASREFVSKADALPVPKGLPDPGCRPDGAENPMPASIEVRRPQAADSLPSTRWLAQGRAGDVRFDRRWLARLSSIVSGLRWVGWLFGRGAMAVLTVSTVVHRASRQARRTRDYAVDGCPMGLLRGPLVVEGTLHGGCGAGGDRRALCRLCPAKRNSAP